MEKIQAALAKARAEREGLDPLAPSQERVAAQTTATKVAAARAQAHGAPQPVAAAAPVAPSVSSAQITENWQALTPCVPKAGVLRRNRVIGLESGPESTTVDVMRTKILHQMRAHGWKRLAITSPSANCGKSTLTTNLAFSLARQPDLRTIVCDMDFRRPTLSNILGLREPCDFSKVLSGESTFQDEAVRPRPNLAFGLTATKIRNSAELLQSPDVGPALDKIAEDYAPDLMIFDTPAMFASDDTMAFVHHVDCVLLIAAAGQSTVREIDICETDMAQQTNIMGVILNKCRYMEKDYSYGGGY